jgi:hypothetical protein
MTEVLESTELYCVDCGYDLRQLDSERCPECGAVIDRTVSGQSIIPWRQRAWVGWFRGFWDTVWLVSRHPAKLAVEMNRPADLAAALRFRQIVVMLATLVLAPASMIAAHVLAEANGLSPFFNANDPLGSAIGAFGLLCVLAGCLAFLLCATGVSSYFFDSRSLSIEQQNRAIALSYYACGPLAYAPLVAFFCGVLIFHASAGARWYVPLWLRIALFITAALPPLLLALVVWRTPVRLMRVATRCDVHRQAAMRILLPIAWALLAGLFVVVIPAMLVAICLMIGMLLS